jgi:hypothetical protein
MLIWISLALFIAFLVVGGIDGIYFHIVRFRLWAAPEGWLEHVLHTARAVLVAPMLWLIFVAEGARLWPLIALVVLDLAATVGDVVVESKSRAPLGGLPRAELAIHVAATVFHVGALGFAFASVVSDGAVVPHPELLRVVALGLIAAGALAALHHILLAVRGAPAVCCVAKEAAV